MEFVGQQKMASWLKGWKSRIEQQAQSLREGADRPAAEGFFAWPVLTRQAAVAALVLVIVQLLGGLLGGSAWWLGGRAQGLLGVSAGMLASVSLAIRAWRASREPLQAWLSWVVMAASAACFTLARISWLIWPAVQGVCPAPACLLDWLFSALFLFGVCLLPYSSPLPRGMARVWDMVIVAASSFLLTWLYFLRPALEAHVVSGGAENPLAWIASVAVPLGDLLVLWGLIILLMHTYPPHIQPTKRLLMAAGGSAIISDSISVGLLAGSPLSSPIWPAVLQILAACLFMLAGAQTGQPAQSGKPESIRPNRSEPAALQALRLGTPIIWVGIVFLLIRITPFDPSFWSRRELSLWVGGIIALVIVRQVIELGNNRRLDRSLQELKESLENRVEERTAELVKANQELRHEMTVRTHIEQILREREEVMEYTAMHDALTELPNRLLLTEHLRQAIRKIQRWDNYNFLLLFIDFDGFKTVNDRLGHLVGDKLLVAVAQRLRHYVRQADTVARLGGDEFVVLLEDVPVENGACPAVDRIRDVVREPYEVDGQHVILSASIGVVVGDKSYQQPSDFLRDADLAMYEAKARGKDCYVIFSPELRSHALDRLVLEDDLRTALDGDGLILHYHPILCLSTHRITGFEALVRWQHPLRGTIMPETFIPIAETSHLIRPLSRRILLEACSQLMKWHASHPTGRDLTISVNLSPALFAHPGALGVVEEVLDETGLAPRFLRLEITEGAMVKDNDNILAILTTWRRRGIQVQMDDFGTGYASLSYLHRFPMDALKIDRSFIHRIQPNGEQGEIARTVITLARELNMEVIAEGVETFDQLAFLESLGCQYAQGFLIAQPLPAAEVDAFLRAYTGPVANWVDPVPTDPGPYRP